MASPILHLNVDELQVMELNLLREIIAHAASRRLGRHREAWEVDLSLLQLHSSIPNYLVFKRNVYSAIYGDQLVSVKFKELYDEIEVQSVLELFRKKAADWQLLDHPNVTKFIGASFVDYPAPSMTCCVLVEENKPYPGLPLKDYFPEHHNLTNLPFQLVLRFALQLARGLRYLHSKNIIHGKLIPENLVLDNTHTRLKIRDFVAANIKQRIIPNDDLSGIQFMAPEFFQGKTCNEKSDVYSFGVCLWAIYFCDEAPYRKRGNYQIISHLQLNHRPFIPPSCPTPFASIMCQCWNGDPDSRPSIFTVVTLLESIYQDFIDSTEKMSRLSIN